MDEERVKGAADKAKGVVKDALSKITAKRRCKWKAKLTRLRAPRMRPSATSRTPHVKRTNANSMPRLKAVCGRPFSFRHKRKRDANGQKETRGQRTGQRRQSPYLQAEAAAQASKSKVIVFAIAGADLSNALKQANEFKLAPAQYLETELTRELWRVPDRRL